MPPNSYHINFGFHWLDRGAAVDYLLFKVKDTFEDPREFSHIEDIMELGRSGKHGFFDVIPELNSGIREPINDSVDFG
jgi:hypothetical protein